MLMPVVVLPNTMVPPGRWSVETLFEMLLNHLFLTNLVCRYGDETQLDDFYLFIYLFWFRRGVLGVGHSS